MHLEQSPKKFMKLLKWLENLVIQLISDFILMKQLEFLLLVIAALEAGADGIDLAASPVSGGTSQPDILPCFMQQKV